MMSKKTHIRQKRPISFEIDEERLTKERKRPIWPNFPSMVPIMSEYGTCYVKRDLFESKDTNIIQKKSKETCKTEECDPHLAKWYLLCQKAAYISQKRPTSFKRDLQTIKKSQKRPISFERDQTRSVLQCIVVCCRVLCSVLQCIVVCCSVL